jgi:hypothetical protein
MEVLEVLIKGALSHFQIQKEIHQDAQKEEMKLEVAAFLQYVWMYENFYQFNPYNDVSYAEVTAKLKEFGIP